jgi:glucose repression regulatory protein TUP1
MRDGATEVLPEDNPMVLDSPCYLSAGFSPNGRCIAASHRDGLVRIWNVNTGHLMRRVLAHADYVYGIAFTPDGKGLVSGCSDKTLKYWDTSSLSTTRRSPTTTDLHGHVEEQIQPEREFFGHEVRLSYSPSFC